MSVRQESGDKDTVEAGARIGGDLLPAGVAHEAVVTDDDGGAIEILDNDETDDADTLETPYDADSLLGTTSVLTSGEEAPPLLRSRDYAAAFFNTDPRIAFDALHIGALRAIEACEHMTRSDYDYPPWYVPPATYVAPSTFLSSSSPSSDAKPFFTVGAMHPLVQSRPPIEREDRRVEELLSHPTREALMAAIGPDILGKLRLHRNSEGRRGRRKDPPQAFKTHATPSLSPN
jgi:hypothetical protein